MKRSLQPTEAPGATAFINARLVDPASGRDEPGGLVVTGSEIVDLGPHLRRNAPQGAAVVDCDGHVLCPGLIDAQVYTGDPGQAAAAEVLQTQSIEVGMMRAWLTDWGQSTSEPTNVMVWMGMGGDAGIPLEDMMGYASEEEMRELALAEGTERGRVWLELMRAHHVGGVHMATAAIDLVVVEKVRRLAQTQIDVQTFEIEQYDLLLATDYA